MAFLLRGEAGKDDGGFLLSSILHGETEAVRDPGGSLGATGQLTLAWLGTRPPRARPQRQNTLDISAQSGPWGSALAPRREDALKSGEEEQAAARRPLGGTGGWSGSQGSRLPFI